MLHGDDVPLVPVTEVDTRVGTALGAVRRDRRDRIVGPGAGAGSIPDREASGFTVIGTRPANGGGGDGAMGRPRRRGVSVLVHSPAWDVAPVLHGKAIGEPVR